MKKLTMIKAIRAKCLDCSGYQPKEIRLCTLTDCSLWPYRMVHKPKGGSDEESVQKSWEGVDLGSLDRLSAA